MKGVEEDGYGRTARTSENTLHYSSHESRVATAASVQWQ